MAAAGRLVWSPGAGGEGAAACCAGPVAASAAAAAGRLVQGPGTGGEGAARCAGGSWRDRVMAVPVAWTAGRGSLARGLADPTGPVGAGRVGAVGRGGAGVGTPEEGGRIVGVGVGVGVVAAARWSAAGGRAVAPAAAGPCVTSAKVWGPPQTGCRHGFGPPAAAGSCSCAWCPASRRNVQVLAYIMLCSCHVSSRVTCALALGALHGRRASSGLHDGTTGTDIMLCTCHVCIGVRAGPALHGTA